MVADVTVTDLLVFTNGRGDCLTRTLESFHEQVEPYGSQWVKSIVDDSDDPEYFMWLRHMFCPQGFSVFQTPGGRAGFDGAIRFGWSLVSAVNDEFVFHLEDDFVFNERIHVEDMRRILVADPDVVQVALQRQPWNPTEEAAGGLIASRVDEYIESSVIVYDHVIDYVTQRMFFTTNPSMYRAKLVRRGWPVGAHSEGRFSIDLFADPRLRSAFLGGLHDPPKVTHIGDIRVGTNY